MGLIKKDPTNRIAVIGPDTPPLGERHASPDEARRKSRATLAALVGEDFQSFNPKAAPPLRDVLGAP